MEAKVVELVVGSAQGGGRRGGKRQQFRMEGGLPLREALLHYRE